MSADSDKVKGKADQAAGTVREKTGEAIGNKEMETKGKAQKTEGKLKEALGKVKEAFSGS